jgi:hypothetical protein
MNATPSEYMLIFRDATPESYDAMSLDQKAACLDRWNDWFDGLRTRGKVKDGRPLSPKSRVISSRPGDRHFDGPFSEAKEAIGGFFLITAADFDEATEIARGCPNLRHGMTVEVREVATGCHLAKALGRTAMRA